MLRILTVAAAALLFTAAPLVAQQGFSLKGHYIYNYSTVEGADTIPSAQGFGIGAEYVMANRLGVGASLYTAGSVGDFDVETSTVTLLGEANYFFRLPVLPISPYVGIHAGFGSFTYEGVQDGDRPETDDLGARIGYQGGIRVQLTQLFGLDAQLRRMSSFVSEGVGDFEQTQLLVGVTLF
jgi:hypothetical protein